MNRTVVLFHLREAVEQLQETIQGFESSGDYGVEEFQVEMGHLGSKVIRLEPDMHRPAVLKV